MPPVARHYRAATLGVEGLPQKQRVGPCVFCQRVSRFTQEHVIPRWVRKVLNTGPVEITDRQTRDRFRYDQTLTLVVNDAVCQECNGGWLRRLGERVKPDVSSAILGSPMALTSMGARSLAIWATERAVLFGLALRAALLPSTRRSHAYDGYTPIATIRSRRPEPRYGWRT